MDMEDKVATERGVWEEPQEEAHLKDMALVKVSHLTSPLVVFDLLTEEDSHLSTVVSQEVILAMHMLVLVNKVDLNKQLRNGE